MRGKLFNVSKRFLIFITLLTATIILFGCKETAADNQYTITFIVGDSATVTPNQITLNAGDKITTPSATKAGFSLEGWYLESSFVTKWVFETDIVESNMSLYAKWISNISPVTQHTITFNTNGGSTIENIKVGNNQQLALPESPTKESYTFIGWFTDSALTKLFEQTTPIDRDITLYAKWQETAKILSLTLLANDKYEVSGLNDTTIAELSIPAMYNNKPVISIGDSAFEGVTNLKSIVIPKSVVTIELEAFSGCTSLSSVIFAKDSELLNINGYAFENCSSLTSIIIPDSVTTISSGAFVGCESLKEMTIPFAGQSRTANRYNLTFGYIFGQISYPNSYSAEGYYVPSSLRKVIITDMESIGYRVFSGCSGLISITLPKQLTSIGSEAFSRCESLRTIELPEGLTVINSSTFAYCSNLSSITIPKSVTSIKQSAFDYCSNLSTVTFEKDSQLLSIGSSAFNSCHSLKSIILPNKLEQLGGSVFKDCLDLETINLPDSLKSIGMETFSGCIKITSIYIPKGVTQIDSKAFYSSPNMVKIEVSVDNLVYDSRNQSNAIIETASNKLISGCQTTIIDPSVTIIGDHAFANNLNLTEITIPNSVVDIERFAFYNCSKLTSIILPDSMTKINSNAFYNCKNLVNVSIPNSVTTIESNAFYDCTNLKSIVIPTSVTSLSSSAFYRVTGVVIYTENTSKPSGWSISQLDDITVYFKDQWHYDETGNPTPNQ